MHFSVMTVWHAMKTAQHVILNRSDVRVVILDSNARVTDVLEEQLPR